jgi:hypothetical protein
MTSIGNPSVKILETGLTRSLAPITPNITDSFLETIAFELTTNGYIFESVTSERLANLSVQTRHINDRSITGIKLAEDLEMSKVSVRQLAGDTTTVFQIEADQSVKIYPSPLPVGITLLVNLQLSSPLSAPKMDHVSGTFTLCKNIRRDENFYSWNHLSNNMDVFSIDIDVPGTNDYVSFYVNNDTLYLKGGNLLESYTFNASVDLIMLGRGIVSG